MENCIHHWVIDPPLGPVSKGVCIKCEEEKNFENIFWYSGFDIPIMPGCREREKIGIKEVSVSYG